MEMKSQEKLTIILGAGASRGCVGDGIAARAKAEYAPPLAREIFDDRFDPILRQFLRLAAHLDHLRTLLKVKDANFETILRDLYDSAERGDDRWSLDIPLYLRELFWTISDEYVEGSSKYDTLVQRVLSSSFKKVLFLNLNYDLFVERALQNCNRHTFDSMNSYVPINKKWLLVKPHGSVNWARVLENWPQYASGDYMSFPSDIEKPPRFGSQIQIVLRTMQLPMRFYIAGVAERRLYPELVVPVEDPRRKRFVCPKEHENQARGFVESCKTFLFIGFSGRDDDVLELLRRMPGSSRVIVVSNGDATEVFERIHARNPGVESKDVAVELHDEGFSHFIESAAFSKLVAPETGFG